jgi:hypothetical protein
MGVAEVAIVVVAEEGVRPMGASAVEEGTVEGSSWLAEIDRRAWSNLENSLSCSSTVEPSSRFSSTSVAVAAVEEGGTGKGSSADSLAPPLGALAIFVAEEEDEEEDEEEEEEEEDDEEEEEEGTAEGPFRAAAPPAAAFFASFASFRFRIRISQLLR